MLDIFQAIQAAQLANNANSAGKMVVAMVDTMEATTVTMHDIGVTGELLTIPHLIVRTHQIICILMGHLNPFRECNRRVPGQRNDATLANRMRGSNVFCQLLNGE